MKVFILSNLMDAHQRQQRNDNIDYIYYSTKQGCDMWGKWAFSSVEYQDILQHALIHKNNVTDTNMNMNIKT